MTVVSQHIPPPSDATDVPKGKAEETGFRRCIASAESLPRERLIRFVVGPDDGLVPDLAERLPGRGLWITADRDMIGTAISRGLFAKAARRRVQADVGLVDRVEELLVRRLANTMGLAQSAGRAVQGFDGIEAWLKTGQKKNTRVAGVLVAARDASERGTEKFKGLAFDVPLIRPLTSDEMGQALGRSDATYVAVERGNFSERLLIDAERLQGFRNSPPMQELNN